MTSLSLSSIRTASEHSSPRWSHRTHPAEVSNSPHLQVLGRDGRDLPLFEHDNRTTTTATSTPPVNTATSAVAAVAVPPPSTSKHWWNNGWNAHKKEEEQAPTYASLDGETQVETAATTAVTPFTSSLTTTTTATNSTLSPSAAVQALLMEPTTRTTVSPTTLTDATSSHYTNATLSSSSQQTNEDLIRQDCSFFYRDMDEVAGSPTGRRTPRSKAPPRQQSAYRIRYQQLNQDSVHMQNDLEFYESEADDGAPQKYPRTCSDLTNHSFLHYKQNDRMLMKLPKDKVRLVMDPELGQAGILSAVVNKEDDISYILTVSPDLYRKVVLDLGPTSCLWETHDRVSMHIAVLLLIGILLTLFIFTLMYPGD